MIFISSLTNVFIIKKRTTTGLLPAVVLKKVNKYVKEWLFQIKKIRERAPYPYGVFPLWSQPRCDRSFVSNHYTRKESIKLIGWPVEIMFFWVIKKLSLNCIIVDFVRKISCINHLIMLLRFICCVLYIKHSIWTKQLRNNCWQIFGESN